MTASDDPQPIEAFVAEFVSSDGAQVLPALYRRVICSRCGSLAIAYTIDDDYYCASCANVLPTRHARINPWATHPTVRLPMPGTPPPMLSDLEAARRLHTVLAAEIGVTLAEKIITDIGHAGLAVRLSDTEKGPGSPRHKLAVWARFLVSATNWYEAVATVEHFVTSQRADQPTILTFHAPTATQQIGLDHHITHYLEPDEPNEAAEQSDEDLEAAAEWLDDRKAGRT